MDTLIKLIEKYRIAELGLSDSHKVRVDFPWPEEKNYEEPHYQHIHLNSLLNSRSLSDQDRLETCGEFLRLWICKSRKEEVHEFFSKYISSHSCTDYINENQGQLWGITVTSRPHGNGSYTLRIWIEKPGDFSPDHVGCNSRFLLDCTGPLQILEIFRIEFSKMVSDVFETKQVEINEVNCLVTVEN